MEGPAPSNLSARLYAKARLNGYPVDSGAALEHHSAPADVYHAQTGAELIARHCIDAHDHKLALEAANRALGALWMLLDAC